VIELPEVLAIDRGPRFLRLDLRIPPDLNCFKGHFPGLPLLPGAVQVDWAIRYARDYFVLPPRFHELRNLKFMRFVEPGARLTLQLEELRDSHEVTFGYHDAEGAFCVGRMGFVA
jgi:3-hydroxymyristoyl/3-hydroxydecanoyl-(acyl carrier protein) dehydratase